MNPSGERSALAYGGPVVGSRSGRTLLVGQLGHGRRFSSSRRLEDLRPGTGNRAQMRLSAVEVAVAPDGGAVAVWSAMAAGPRFEHPRYRLRVAHATTSGGFERSRTLLSASRPFEITGLVAARGGLAVVALRRDERMQVVLTRRRSRRPIVQDLGPSTVYVAPASLALAPRGGVLAAWSPTYGSTAQAALLAARGHRFAAARTVSAAGEVASYAGAVAGPGGAGVAWTATAAQIYPAPVAGRLRFARLTSAAGGFAAPVTLADAKISGVGQVVLPRGRAAATWRRYIDVTEPGDSDKFVDAQLFARTTPDSDPAPRALSQLPAIAFAPVSGALRDRALIAWREAPVATNGSRLRLAVAGPGGWAATVTVADGGRDVRTTPERGIEDDERPADNDVAIATGSGSALLAWTALTRQANGATLHRMRLVSYRP
jgi:hypothetical protein